MRLFIAALLVAAAFIFIVPGVSAATYTVPGDYATLQAAINAASAGDTISITDDLDDYNVQVNVSGLTFKGNGFTLNSTGANELFEVDVNDTAFEDINFIGDQIIIFWGDYESPDTVEGLAIDNCTFTQTISYGGGVGRSAVDVEHGGAIGGLTLTNCNFTYGTDEVGLVLMTWLHPLLYNVWIENCTMIDGTEFVDINDASSNVTIINNVCHSSTADAWWVAFYWGAHDGITITGNYFYDADPSSLPESNIYLNLDDGGITNFNCTKNFYEDYTGEDDDGDGWGETVYSLTTDGMYNDTSPFAGHYRCLVDAYATVFEIFSETDAITGPAWDDSTGKLNFTCPNNVDVEGSNGMPVTQFWIFNNGTVFSDYVFWLGVISLTGLADAETIIDFDTEGLNGAGGDVGGDEKPPDNSGEEPPPDADEPELPFEPPPVPPIPESVEEAVRIVAWGAFLIAAMIVGSTVWKAVSKHRRGGVGW